MENTIAHLMQSGAVRHGAECFNYYFPQELYDEFLVILDVLSVTVRWKYMETSGLQSFLSDKIDDGYTAFPLNPKWALCDSGRWKELYDKLMASEVQEVKESLDIWYPPESDVRA